MDDPFPTWTSPITEALGATNASLSTTGALSNMFIRVRCLDTKTQEMINVVDRILDSIHIQNDEQYVDFETMRSFRDLELIN